MAGNATLSLTYCAFVVGGLLVIAARLHKYTFRPLVKDARREQQLYWVCSVVGGVVATAAMITHGATAVLAIGILALWSTVLYRPGGPTQRRRWER